MFQGLFSSQPPSLNNATGIQITLQVEHQLKTNCQAQSQLKQSRTELALLSTYTQYGPGYMQYGVGYMQHGLGYM